MNTIKTILVPVDFSAVAQNAFNYALHLADRYAAQIELLHCVPTSIDSPGFGPVTIAHAGEMHQRAEENMKAFRQRGVNAAMKEMTGIPNVSTAVESAELENAIKKRLATEPVDLIIMGASGDDKPLASLIGTNSSYLIDDVTVPVLVVPDEASFRRPAKLAYATDLEHLDAFSATSLLSFFSPFEPVIDFVHISPSAAEETTYDLELLRKAIERPGNKDRLSFTTIRGKDAVGELLTHAGLTGVDLVVMNRPHRSWLERLWKRSHTQAAVLRTQLPLLILHQAEAA